MGNEVSQPADAGSQEDRPETPTVSRPQEEEQDEGGSGAPMPSALVIVGPSGVGKGTLIAKLMAGNDQFGFSTSHTTRQPRPGEVHGEHYFYTTKETFAAEIAEGKFLEFAEVHGRLYGTSRMAVDRVLNTGRVCILDVDVQGARALRKSGLRGLFVFIAPPSLEDLARRLAGRGTETAEQIHLRMSNAKGEINSLNEKGLYDYLIINEHVEVALDKLKAISARAAGGLDAEPGQVPESVIIEEAPLPDLAELMAIAQTAAEQADGTQSVAAATPFEPAAAGGAAGLVLSPEAAEQMLQHHSLATRGMSTVELAMLAGGSSQSYPAADGAAAGAGAGANPVHGSGGGGELAGGAPSPSYSPAPYADGMERWAGRVALVTGASSGIGRAVCEALALCGLRVVAVARRKERLEQLQQHMHQALGVPPSSFLPVVCDVTKEAEVATLPKIVSKRWDGCGIDVLINNAGLSRNDASMFDGNVASWVEMLSTNVLGNAMCTRAVLSDMQARGVYGHIINMVGLSGHRIPDGPDGGGFYCGTKAAVKMMTEGLRQEARGRNVPLRVSSISPGIVETEFFTVKAYGDPSATSNATSQFQCLQPEDVAQAMLWCLSAPDHVEVNDIVVRPTMQML
ncbi:hypothetical protein FOA52_007789 [Chlamydomonas sp. UWO 241]|nr:hypothetical protein FOA52_007789 [Chlamydomonas sp. UWO 241]